MLIISCNFVVIGKTAAPDVKLSQQFSSDFPGYDVYNVPQDGQCAFSSISHQLLIKKYVVGEISGDIVRRDVVNFLRRNDSLRSIISERLTEETIDDYISNMERTGTYRNVG